jgi:hypothetical protein
VIVIGTTFKFTNGDLPPAVAVAGKVRDLHQPVVQLVANTWVQPKMLLEFSLNATCHHRCSTKEIGRDSVGCAGKIAQCTGQQEISHRTRLTPRQVVVLAFSPDHQSPDVLSVYWTSGVPKREWEFVWQAKPQQAGKCPGHLKLHWRTTNYPYLHTTDIMIVSSKLVKTSGQRTRTP